MDFDMSFHLLFFLSDYKINFEVARLSGTVLGDTPKAKQEERTIQNRSYQFSNWAYHSGYAKYHILSWRKYNMFLQLFSIKEAPTVFAKGSLWFEKRSDYI